MSRAIFARRLLLPAAALALLGAAGPAPPRRPTPSLQQRKSARPAASSRYAGEPISLDLKDADLRDVLRTFATLARLNIAIDPEVKGSVTVRLHDVPWDQALDVILQINGLGSVLEGNVLRVGEPRKLIPPPAIE